MLISLFKEDFGEVIAAEDMARVLESDFNFERNGITADMNFAQFSEWYSTDSAKLLLNKAFNQTVSKAVKSLR